MRKSKQPEWEVTIEDCISEFGLNPNYAYGYVGDKEGSGGWCHFVLWNVYGETNTEIPDYLYINNPDFTRTEAWDGEWEEIVREVETAPSEGHFKAAAAKCKAFAERLRNILAGKQS